MRFDPANQHLFDASGHKLRNEVLRTTRAETRFLDRLNLRRHARDDLGSCMLQALWILFGYDQGNLEQARAVHRFSNTGSNLAEVRNYRPESFLHVYNREGGRLAGKLMDVIHKKLILKKCSR
jgi:hypothetical protein